MMVLRTLCRKKNSTTPVMIAASTSSFWTSSTVCADGAALVDHQLQAEAGRQLGVDLLDARQQRVHRLGDVGVGLLVDQQAGGRLAVHPQDRLGFLAAEVDPAPRCAARC